MNPDPHDAASLRAYHGIELPAAHGIANARSLARLCAAVIGEVDGVRLLSPAMLAAATTPQTDGLPALVESATAGPDLRFGLGFQRISEHARTLPGVLRTHRRGRAPGPRRSGPRRCLRLHLQQ